MNNYLGLPISQSQITLILTVISGIMVYLAFKRYDTLQEKRKKSSQTA